MNVIDDSGTYRQKWFDFKNQSLFDWVKDQIDKVNHYEAIMKKQEGDKD